MASFGFTYTPYEQPNLDSLADGDVTRSGLWGFFDPSVVTTKGYDSVVVINANDLPSNPLSADGGKVYTGEDTATGKTVTMVDGHKVPKGGCRQVGDDAIGGIVLFPSTVSLPDAGPHLPLTDPRVVAANRQWSACMQTAGFNYPDPSAALSDAKWQSPPASGQTSPPPTSADEIATATADIDCKISTNLVGIDTAVQSAYDNQYIESHVTQLAEFQAQLQGYIKAAGTGK